MTQIASSTPPPPSPPPRGRRASWKATLVKLAFSITLLLVLFELACQVFLWKMNRQWQQVKQEPGHYFQPSDDPVLVYELVVLPLLGHGAAAFVVALGLVLPLAIGFAWAFAAAFERPSVHAEAGRERVAEQHDVPHLAHL